MLEKPAEREIKNRTSRDKGTILEKPTEVAPKNGKSRDKCTIGHKTQNDEQQKAKNTSQKTKKMDKIDPCKNRGYL